MAGKKQTSETQNTPSRMTQSCASFFRLFVVFLFLVSWNKQYAHSTYARLEKHADDGHHRKSSVCNFSIELLGFLSRVSRGQHLESKVSSICISSWGLFLGDFAESHVGQDLTPSSRVGIWASKLCQPTQTSKTHLIAHV